MASIKPLGNRVLVKRLEAESVSAGGIVLPDSAQEKPQEAEVTALGTGGIDEDTDGLLAATSLLNIGELKVAADTLPRRFIEEIVDTDGDGVADPIDLDDDGSGELERVEVESAIKKMFGDDIEQEVVARFGIRSLQTVVLFKDGQPVDAWLCFDAAAIFRRAKVPDLLRSLGWRLPRSGKASLIAGRAQRVDK